MTDLIVTSAVLEDSTAKLVAIKAEFDEAGKRMKAEAEVWGQHDVTKAMHDFVDNWGIHRGKISTAVGDLQKKMQEMVDGWTETEKQLHDGLTTDTQTQ
jgi:molecular chaperone GrpE (heat shock protein)